METKNLTLAVTQSNKKGNVNFQLIQDVETNNVDKITVDVIGEHMANVLFDIMESQNRIKETVSRTRFFKLAKGNPINLVASIDGINLLEHKLSLSLMGKLTIGNLTREQFIELVCEYLRIITMERSI